MEDIEKDDFLRPDAKICEDMGPYATTALAAPEVSVAPATQDAEDKEANARQHFDAAISSSLSDSASSPETPKPETPNSGQDGRPDDIPEPLRPLADKAARFDRMQEILRHHEISGEEMDAALGLSVALRFDPVRALEQLTPLVARLQEIVGASMPEDLHNAVMEGAITEPLALELAQSRAQQRLAQQQSQKQLERYTTHMHDAAAAAAAHWEQRMRATDPGFASRLDAVQAIARGFLVSEGLPPGEDGLVRTLERADAQLRAAIQPTALAATAPVPAPTRTATGTRQPRSLSGAVAMALGER